MDAPETALHETVALALPALADTPVGVAGADPPALGVTELDALDGALEVAPLVATTVKVYAIPFVSPTTLHDVVEVEQVIPPGLEVTTYPVAPETEFHETVALAFPALAITPVGAARDGTPALVTTGAPEDAT